MMQSRAAKILKLVSNQNNCFPQTDHGESSESGSENHEKATLDLMDNRKNETSACTSVESLANNDVSPNSFMGQNNTFEKLQKAKENTIPSLGSRQHISADGSILSSEKNTTFENFKVLSRSEKLSPDLFDSRKLETSACPSVECITNNDVSPNSFTGESNTLFKKVQRVKRNIAASLGSHQNIAADDSILSSVKNIAKTTADFDSDDSVADPTFEKQINTSSEASNEAFSEEKQRKAEKRTTRKRKSNPKAWTRNVKKEKRHSGLEYSTKTNRVIDRKSLKPACNDTCKLKCKKTINQEVRQRINEQFWTHQKSIDMKRQFIASHVQQLPVKRRRERNNLREGKRQFTNKYFLEVEGKHITVCKTFFLNTLNISQQSVDTSITKKRDSGLISPDKRGKHIPINKISEEIRNNVRNHISRFPTYESHYSRERSKKRYLGNHLNITRMYALYLEDCAYNNISQDCIAKEWLYSEIFNYEFNFSFKPPDNDTCDICDRFKLQLQEVGTQENLVILQQQYEQHLELEDANNRYKLKSEDKDRMCFMIFISICHMVITMQKTIE